MDRNKQDIQSNINLIFILNVEIFRNGISIDMNIEKDKRNKDIIRKISDGIMVIVEYRLMFEFMAPQPIVLFKLF